MKLTAENLPTLQRLVNPLIGLSPWNIELFGKHGYGFTLNFGDIIEIEGVTRFRETVEPEGDHERVGVGGALVVGRLSIGPRTCHRRLP